MLAIKRAIKHPCAIFVRSMTSTAPGSHFDYLVIGGGSGGVASSRRAASYGAKTALIEGSRLGGTCVNMGCVPKKVMFNAADLAVKTTEHARQYNIEAPTELKFDWKAFKGKVDAYVERLNGIYERNLAKENVALIRGWAKFKDEHTVEVTTSSGAVETYTADKIMIAVGGTPARVSSPKGADTIGITSNGFFELESQPKSVALIGSGYIGVELAGIFNALGSETHLVIRHGSFLRNFDSMIGETLGEIYEKHGVKIHRNANASAIERLSSGKIKLSLATPEGEEHLEVDEVVWAIGRDVLSYNLALENTGVKTAKNGKIIVDEWQVTSVPHIYSLGDVSEDIELTPVAIAAGRKLGDRLFGGHPEAKQDYTNIPSAIFSHPEAASIGISAKDAVAKYGEENVKVYQSKFINMYYSPMEQEMKDPAVYKLVVAGPEEKVVGLHLVGDGSSEILQGFGVAIKMGATKADFDSCVAIHPTAAEELVTLT